MTTAKIIWLIVLSLAFYVCGWVCVFKTSLLVEMGRRNYQKNKLVQAYPFSSMVMKPWYPAYIRGAGIFIWLWAIAIDCLVLFAGFR